MPGCWMHGLNVVILDTVDVSGVSSVECWGLVHFGLDRGDGGCCFVAAVARQSVVFNDVSGCHCDSRLVDLRWVCWIYTWTLLS